MLDASIPVFRSGAMSRVDLALAEIGYLDAPQPGFFVEQRDGRRWVESIIPGSPASRVLFPGDELVTVNRGKPASFRASWESDTSGDAPLYTLPSFDDICELAKIGGRVDKQATMDTIDGLRNVALRAYLLAALAGGLAFGHGV